MTITSTLTDANVQAQPKAKTRNLALDRARTFLTLVVDDVFAAVERARALEVEIIEEPVALDYGQTRALIRDPNGLVIDLSTPTVELRGDVDIEPMPRTVAIDQQQPEDRDRSTPL